MTASSIFLDTAPFIYLLENHPVFCQKVGDFIAEGANEDATFQTSVLTYAEYCIQPERRGQPELIRELEDLFGSFGIVPAPVSLDIATTSYRLRAKYRFLHGMDSLQVATALVLGASVFFTNDRKLKGVQEIRVVLVSEL